MIVYRIRNVTEPSVIARVRSTRGNLIVGSYFYCRSTKTSKILPRDCHAPFGARNDTGYVTPCANKVNSNLFVPCSAKKDKKAVCTVLKGKRNYNFWTI